MLFIRRQGLVITAAILSMLLGSTGSALGYTLSPLNVVASAMVPGQEARYVINFRADTVLDLSKGASITVEFPPGFKIIADDIYAADPGCTLTRLEYKNPNDRFFAVVKGITEVKKLKNGVKCSFRPQMEQLVIPACTELYLTIPGIVNVTTPGNNGLKLIMRDARGNDYQGQGEFSLGLPLKAAPQQVRLIEASSYNVQLAWNPVPGATRYRVVFASQPDGQFISALDFPREPLPGEDWQLVETTHSFSGRGNGGLKPGDTYYFKVLAGNEFGFGAGSDSLRVTLPEIKLLNNQLRDEKQDSPEVPDDNCLMVRVNQPVKIADADGIRVYNKTIGIRVKPVNVTINEADNQAISINAAMPPGQEYLVVFYEGALESQTQPGVCNKTFSMTVAVGTKRQGGSL